MKSLAEDVFGWRKHLYSMKNSLRDAFRAADTSLFDGKFVEGCFSSGGYIPIRRNSSPGIIFQRRMHPYSENFVARDYFPEANASLFGKFVTRDYFPEANASLSERIRFQGLFSRGECIPIRKNSPPGIIFPRRIHPYSKEFAARDYFPEANASLFVKIRRQGLLFHGKCIPDELFR